VRCRDRLPGARSRWSFKPLSAMRALYGRHNRKGTRRCIWRSMHHGGARDHSSLARKFDPCVLCCYDFDCEPLATCGPTLGARTHVKLAEMRSAWFLEAAAGGSPHPGGSPIADGARLCGLLTPSFAPGATQDAHNSACGGVGASDESDGLRPSGKLPKDQLPGHRSLNSSTVCVARSSARRGLRGR